MIIERRQVDVRASATDTFRVFSGLGGHQGWLFGNWLWHLRGSLDRLIGGVGYRRGRRHPEDLRVGDAVDFWRVEAVEPGEMIRLRAEMKVPGRAWLQFETRRTTPGRSQLAQTAFFAPKGLSGLAYWYALYPLHSVIFSGMPAAIAARAESLSRDATLEESAGPSAG